MDSMGMSSTSVSLANIAVNRFGYGARAAELELAKSNPKQWIIKQLQPISFSGDFPYSNDVLIEIAQYRKAKKLRKDKQKSNPENNALENKQPQQNVMGKSFPRKAYLSMSADTLNQAISSSNSVSWRLLDFFSNHFSVSTNGRAMMGLSATLEREAIAPNLLGRFSDMLQAVVQHPAMLIYLNNERSFGPNSKLAKKTNKGLNENLAREILELHTLGVNGGYAQGDVVELAKAITGWSLKNSNKGQGSGFIFRQYGHEPGRRILLGKHYSQQGIEQGKQMLADLAVHPATAKHVCYKLAHHFVSENPPSSLLAKMESVWLSSEGNIKQVMHCLFAAEESWMMNAQKFKTPREFVISTYRALSAKGIKDKVLLAALVNLGQQPFNAGSPAGYSDKETDWLGASALMARIDWSVMISAYRKKENTEKIMSIALGNNVSEQTYNTVVRAESRQQALTLLLMSPEFQRR